MKVNMLLILLSIFYLPVFIIRAVIVRCFGPNYGISILDDLFNPDMSSKHNDRIHSVSQIKLQKTKSSPKKIKIKFSSKKQNKNSVEKELELADRELDRLIQQRFKYPSLPILADSDFQELTSDELP
jgi:hypothetical protein